MSKLSIQIPQVPEIIEETIQQIPEDYKLVYTHELSSHDILNNLPIFQIYEHEDQKYLALLEYTNKKYHPYYIQLLENVIGTTTKVIIHGINGDQPIDAKLDTGADVCSLNAQNVQINNNQVLFDAFGKRYRMMLASQQNIKTADNGNELRPVVKMSIKINDKVINDVMVNLNDRGNMANFLIGMNCIKNLNMKIDPNLKEYVDASLKILENWDDDEDGEEDLSHLVSVKVAESLKPLMASAAQKIYNKWDETDIDTYANGGICHYIADAICDVLNSNNIECTTVSSDHEVHVFTVARFIEGIFSIDIHHSNYETGGGYSWKKIRGVKFSPQDIDFYCISRDPTDYNNYIEQY